MNTYAILMQDAIEELNGLEETEDAAKDAYDKAVASGGPDLEVDPADDLNNLEVLHHANKKRDHAATATACSGGHACVAARARALFLSLFLSLLSVSVPLHAFSYLCLCGCTCVRAWCACLCHVYVRVHVRACVYACCRLLSLK